jgi:hypothetical protein
MAKRTVFHVTQDKQTDKWQVKQEKVVLPVSRHETQAAAAKTATRLAKAAPLGQVKIHGRDNLIRTEHTYRKDPYPPEG